MRDAGRHSGHARCTESGFGASSFARCRSAMSAGACVWSTVEHAQATSEKAAKADVGTFSMAAATQRVAVAASALACPLGPS